MSNGNGNRDIVSEEEVSRRFDGHEWFYCEQRRYACGGQEMMCAKTNKDIRPTDCWECDYGNPIVAVVLEPGVPCGICGKGNNLDPEHPWHEKCLDGIPEPEDDGHENMQVFKMERD